MLVFGKALETESKVRPRVRAVLLGLVSTGSGVDPPLTVKATVVLVLGLESAREPEPANRKQILEIDSLILLILYFL